MKYPTSLAVTWQTSVDQLGDSERYLLEILAWLAPDPLPIAALDADYLSMDVESALSTLADFSLVRWDQNRDTISMHRVVQEIIRNRQLSPVERLTTTLELLCKAAPEGHPGDVRTWVAWEPLQPHALFATQQAERLGINVPTSRLMGELGILLWKKALHEEAEAIERRALELDEKEFGCESNEVATRSCNLALTLQSMNRIDEAEPLLRRSLSIAEKINGPDHPDVARDLNNLALLLQETNRLVEAEPMLRRSIAIFENAFGSHPSVAIGLTGLAQLLRATDRVTEAEPLLWRALAIDEQHYGPDHPEVSHDLNSLGRLLHTTGRIHEAEGLLSRALVIDETAYGHDHPDVARDLSNLARVLQDLGRAEIAEQMLQRALYINERYFGPEHSEVASDLCNLATLHLACSRHQKAEALLNRSLAIYQRIAAKTGYEHPRQCEVEALIGSHKSTSQTPSIKQ